MSSTTRYGYPGHITAAISTSGARQQSESHTAHIHRLFMLISGLYAASDRMPGRNDRWWCTAAAEVMAPLDMRVR